MVGLTVSYPNASEFVSEYRDNLAVGGLFVAGQIDLDMLLEIDVDIALPDGRWTVRAKPVYVLDPVTAKSLQRRIGTGMEITRKPAGFDEAMRAHLTRLGKRREVAVMVGDVPGAAKFGDAGFKLIPLETLEALDLSLSDALVPVIALIVPVGLADAYRVVARAGGSLIAVYSPTKAADIDDIVSQIDRLL